MRADYKQLRGALTDRIEHIRDWGWGWRREDRALLLQARKAIESLEDECQALMSVIARERTRADRAELKLRQRSDLPLSYRQYIEDWLVRQSRKNGADEAMLAAFVAIAITGAFIIQQVTQ